MYGPSGREMLIAAFMCAAAGVVVWEFASFVVRHLHFHIGWF